MHNTRLYHQAEKINRSWSWMLSAFGLVLSLMMVVFIYTQYTRPMFLKHHRL